MATPPTLPDHSRPAVDEWGVYDPEQAGLSALFVKLADDRLARKKITTDRTRADAAAVAPGAGDNPDSRR
jgi:hypothetical protein